MSATELWLYVMTKQRAVKTPREGTNVTVYLVTAKWTASVEVNMLIPLNLMSTVICQISRTQISGVNLQVKGDKEVCKLCNLDH